MQPQKTTVYLVDGSGYIFRAFYAVQALSTKAGFPTNALFGFLRMLGKLLALPDARFVAMVFDAGRETFRNELYPAYKANRAECPVELVQQMPFFREFSSALGLPIFEQKGFEADDLIGTLTERLKQSEIHCVVVTADKDLMQLVSDDVEIWDTMRDRRFRRSEVIEKFGVPPERVADFLGLTGDSSDNIPGLRGCGPKTALQLLEKFGDIETILNSAQALRADPSIRGREKLAAQIESDRDLIRLSRRLVEIERKVPLVVRRGSKNLALEESSTVEVLAALERGVPHYDELGDLIERFEFHSLAKELHLDALELKRDQADAGSYELVMAAGFDKFVEQLSKQSRFSFDFETTSLDTIEAEIIGASFCWSDGKAYYVPIAHSVDALGAHGSQISLERFVSSLKPIFAKAGSLKIAQNLKYDLNVIANVGLEIAGPTFDTMIAAYLLNPDKRSYNLTTLARDFLRRPTIEFQDVVGERGSFAEVPLDQALAYAGQDAWYCWLLYSELAPLIEERGLSKVFEQIEMPLVAVLAAIERIGVELDVEFLNKMSHELEAQLAAVEARIYDLAGGSFNQNSPKQLAEVLFDRLNLSSKGLKRTKTGISTDSSVLEILSAQHPLPAEILKHRMLFKLKSTYVDALPLAVSKRTHRLHTRLNQTSTATGRLSSSEPNLQNIPIMTAEGRRIRQAFRAPSGKLLISADYSQIELRLLAHMSNDSNMIAAFKSGADIHNNTAREIFGLSAGAEVSSEQRRVGKTINFGIVYGMSGFRLGRELGISVSTANSYIEGYFERYPSVKQYFAQLEWQAEHEGFVSTLFGRKRLITDLDTSGRDRGFAARVAINAPIQGSAADIIKLAMIRLDAKIRSEHLGLRMILQIHDELLFEVDHDSSDAMGTLVKSEMESVCELTVPLRVDVGSGATWGDT